MSVKWTVEVTGKTREDAVAAIAEAAKNPCLMPRFKGDHFGMDVAGRFSYLVYNTANGRPEGLK